jgi:ATP-dependent DNA helicase RecG
MPSTEFHTPQPNLIHCVTHSPILIIIALSDHIERRTLSGQSRYTTFMRPEILFPLFAPSSSLKGVGPKIAPLVDRAAGPRVRDLLFLCPQGLIDRRPTTANLAVDGQVQTFVVRVDAHLPPARRGGPWRIRTLDQTGFLFLTWFKGGGPHLEDQHPVGAARAVSGKVERFGPELQIAHPDFMLDAGRVDDIPRIEAVYGTTAGLPSRTLRRLAGEALNRAPDLPEWQDPAWLGKRKWMGWREALTRLHDPKTPDDLTLEAPHRMRLAYDELLAHQMAMAQRKAARRRDPAPAIGASALSGAMEAALPFVLTQAQRRSLSEIRGDLMGGERMSRLLQGDVGSGKTVVAMLAMADVAAAGCQSALMAPTEILARQHYETLKEPLAAQGLNLMILTGRAKGAGRWQRVRWMWPSAPTPFSKTRSSLPTWPLP